MKISLIAAHSKNMIIGDNNSLIWELKDDLLNFKNLTKDSIVIMGRKTYESIGRPLPNRVNIVLTRDVNYHVDGVITANSKKECLDLISSLNKQTFIIGGAEIYKLFMNDCSEYHLTEVDCEVSGDTNLPEMNFDDYLLVNEKFQNENDRNEYSWTYRLFIKHHQS